MGGNEGGSVFPFCATSETANKLRNKVRQNLNNKRQRQPRPERMENNKERFRRNVIVQVLVVVIIGIGVNGVNDVDKVIRWHSKSNDCQQCWVLYNGRRRQRQRQQQMQPNYSTFYHIQYLSTYTPSPLRFRSIENFQWQKKKCLPFWTTISGNNTDTSTHKNAKDSSLCAQDNFALPFEMVSNSGSISCDTFHSSPFHIRHTNWFYFYLYCASAFPKFHQMEQRRAHAEYVIHNRIVESSNRKQKDDENLNPHATLMVMDETNCERIKMPSTIYHMNAWVRAHRMPSNRRRRRIVRHFSLLLCVR